MANGDVMTVASFPEVDPLDPLDPVDPLDPLDPLGKWWRIQNIQRSMARNI